MSDEAIGLEPQGVEEMSYDQAMEQIRSRQNFGLAVVAGLGAAIVGAVLWAVVVYVTNYEIGLIAVAVGAVVGLAVRQTGQGADQKFGILGAACAALGWGLGTVLGDVALAAGQLGLPFGETLTTVDLMALVSTLASPMDLLFLGIAVFEGYKLSFRYRLG
jgi:hypothetical protein